MLKTSDSRIVALFLKSRRPAFEQPGRGRKEGRHFWGTLAALVVIILSRSIAAAPTKEVRRILILNEVGTSYPLTNLVDQGLRVSLENTPYQTEFYREYMDTILFPDPGVQQGFRDFYIHKYQNRALDVIVTVGPTPLKFMVEAHQKYFPGVPIVYCVPNGLPRDLTLDSDFAGVEGEFAAAETVATALRLLPKTKHLVVVGGVADFDRQVQGIIKDQLKVYEDRLDISYLTDLTMPALLEQLKHLPSQTIALVTPLSKDAAGVSFISTKSGPMIVAAANAPIFSVSDRFLNHGEVGGDVSSALEDGKLAGSMVLRILNGEKPQDVRARRVTTYMFDWRALKRWGLKESDLPPGSLVLNRQPTVWESYKSYIISGVSLILLETLLIFGLLWQRARRREAETELVVTNDRLRLAVEAGRSVGWDWDIKSGGDRWFGDLATMFGIPSDTYCGNVAEFRRRVYPEDQALVRTAIADAMQNRKPYVGEFRVVRTDGTVRWITARGKFYYATNGDPERMLGMAVDITDLKHVEQKLRESQDRMAGILGSAMDAIIAIDEEQRVVFFNTAAEKMFGCPQGEAVGSSIDRFVPQFRSEHGAYLRSVAESGATFPIVGTLGAARAVRTNGQEFPIEASISHVESEGRKLFTVIVRDVTVRRQAEAVIRESEERFRLVANTAPVMIWMSSPDKMRNYFNQSWLDFTGRSIEAELGSGWAEMVYPADRQECLDTYRMAFDRHESFKMQFRLRRNDGEYRWVFDIGVPRFNPDGSFAGYIGSCIDTTERKMAEEALANLSGRLIDAQEEERKRIAREIHDDYSQRLALLAIDVENLAEESESSPEQVDQRLHQVWNAISEIGSDLHSLSHRLHSSTLDSLGLVAGVKAFCTEFAEQQELLVDFADENVPSGVPGDVALCLFRIVQEGLRNIKRHSGADRAEVRLEGLAGKLHLSVVDRGRGFDMNNRSRPDGIGIRSMEERLRSLGGQMVVTSRPMEGTRIDAWLPLKVASQNAA